MSNKSMDVRAKQRLSFGVLGKSKVARIRFCPTSVQSFAVSCESCIMLSDKIFLDEAMKNYTAVVEKCADTGLYVGYIPGFAGAHTQAETLDELQANLQEVIEMLLEDGEPQMQADFVGTQTVMVA